MNYTWSTPINKLMHWHASNWRKCDSKSQLFLRIHCDQLLITAESKVFESVNMHHKTKGIYKEDILILIVSSTGHELRKLKFQIKCNVSNCLQKLGEHFPIVKHKSYQSENIVLSKYRRLEDVMKNAMEGNKRKHMDNNALSYIPPVYRNFVKLCLLDPMFPQVVNETEKIIAEAIMKK